MQRGGIQGSPRGTVWSHLFNRDIYSGSTMWPSHRALAQRGGRAEGDGFAAVWLWTGVTGQPSGWKRGPAPWGTRGPTGREPLVGTDHVEQREPQPCDCFPLLDHTKCFQARGQERSTGLGVNLPEELVLLPAVWPWAPSLPPCSFLCESPALTFLPASFGAVAVTRWYKTLAAFNLFYHTFRIHSD